MTAPKELPPYHAFVSGTPVIELKPRGFKAYCKKKDMGKVIAALQGAL